MDANAVTRARSKAEEVRAALQREQRLAVERRLQQLQEGGSAAATAASSTAAVAGSATLHEKPHTANPEAPVNQPGVSTSGVDAPKVAGIPQEQSEGGSGTPTGTSATVKAAAQVAERPAGSSSSLLPGPRNEESKAVSPEAATTGAPTTSASSQEAPRGVGVGSLSAASASITRQVLSASTDGSSGPRYLRYRDSLKRVSATAEMQTALRAKEQFEQAEADDNDLKGQLGSYLEKSVSGAAVGASSTAVPPPSDDKEQSGEIPTAQFNESQVGHRNEPRYVTSDPSKSSQELSVIAALASAAAAKRAAEEEKEEHDSIAPEALMDAETFQRYTEGCSSSTSDKAAPPAASGSKSPQESSMSKSTAAHRVVSFDLDPDDTETTRNRMEDVSESEASYNHGTLTLKEYRRRRAVQCGVLILFLIVLPLAIGLGVAYSNRSAPLQPPTSNTTTQPEVSSLGPTGAPTPTFLRPGGAPSPVPAAPSAAPASSTEQVIGFPPMNSILDLLNVVDGTGTGGSGG